MTPDGLEMRSPGATGSLQWANVAEVYESREFLFFYFSAAWAQALPKRVIPTGTLSSFRAALRDWAGARVHVAAK